MKAVGIILTICIRGPIWFYLLYSILKSVEASELSWFLFWAYVPASVICSLILHFTDGK